MFPIKKMLFSALLVFVSLTLNNSLLAKTLPLEEYSKLASISMVRISPNGGYLAYRAADGDIEKIVIIQRDELKLAGTFDISKIRPNNIYFLDETKLILVATKNMALDGISGKHDISTAFSYDITTRKIHQLLKLGHGIYNWQSGLGSIVGVSQDKRYAFMPAYQTNALGNPIYNLMKVSLVKDKRAPRAFVKGTRDTIDFFMNDKEEVLARERYDNKKDLHIVESKQGKKWVTIFREKTEIRRKAFVGLTPDYQSLIMLANHENGRDTYFKMSLADGKISDPLLVQDDVDIERVMVDNYRVAQGMSYSGFQPSYKFFDKKLDNMAKTIAETLPDNSVKVIDYTQDFEKAIYLVDGGNSSGEYYLYADKKIAKLANARPHIPSDHVNTVIKYEYKARDELLIPTLITLPKDYDSRSQYPAIMMPHGGPESYDKLAFDWLAQYFANRGYLVIQPQFRGSSGFGADHTLKGYGEWGRKMQHDLSDAITDLSRQNVIDKNKVCIVGASYGGYAALAGAAFTPDLYRCAISINGVSDIPEMMKTARREYGKYHWVLSYWNAIIQAGKVDKDHLKNISPINSIEKIDIPILLIHGKADEIVPYTQSKNMFNKLNKSGKQVNYKEIKNEGHYLSKSSSRLQVLQNIDKFLNQHMGK